MNNIESDTENIENTENIKNIENTEKDVSDAKVHIPTLDLKTITGMGQQVQPKKNL